MKPLIAAILTLISLPVWAASADAMPRWQPEDMDSPEAEAAAQAILKQLGPDRGAVAIAAQPVVLVAGFDGGEIYIEGSDTGGIDIIGLESDTAGVPLDLQGLVSDLNADVTGYGYKVSLSGDVLFEFDKATLKPEAKETLQKVVLLATKANAIEIRVEGHTDSKGSNAYNQKLSERRAEAVKSWLVAKGHIEPDIIKAVGFGETRPVADNTTADGKDNPEGRAKNRRVDIYVKKPK